MSPAGLKTYLEGGKSLCNLGRGTDVVISLRAFGVNNYTVIDNVDKLAEQLPLLFASLTP